MRSRHVRETASISPALLRQLAGMGNNLNQIARKLVPVMTGADCGGADGHRCRPERLRHAVLEKEPDDDR
jgi:hypothetical protein